MLLPRHSTKIIDYLKIDIEGGEWDVMKQIVESQILSNVRQLSIEFHLPNKHLPNSNADKYSSLQDYQSLVRIVKSIEDTTEVQDRNTQIENEMVILNIKHW